MKAKLLVGVAIVLSLAFATQIALSQTSAKSKSKSKQKVIELKATKSSTRGEGADPNIKNEKETNDPNSDMNAPEKKGGAKTRGGGYCEVRFDNRSRWFVKLYVDGTYRGTLSPYGDSVVYTGAGETSVYGRAQFDDGTFFYWGPKNYDCYSGQFIYFKMNP